MNITFHRGLMLFIAAFAIAIAAPGCTPDAADDAGHGDSTAVSAGGDDAAATNVAVARRFYDEVFNNGNVALIDSIVSPSFVDHTPSPGQDSTIAGLKQWVGEMRTGFPDSRTEVLHIMGEGDLVVAHIRQTGTNSGPMMGMPATNKSMDMRGVDIVRIVDGKATEHWGYFEEMKMMQQLGLMPAMPGAPPPSTGAAKDSAGASGDAAAPGDTTKK